MFFKKMSRMQLLIFLHYVIPFFEFIYYPPNNERRMYYVSKTEAGDEDDLPISKISESVDYEYPNLFYSHFKKVYGITPAEYRANMPK